MEKPIQVAIEESKEVIIKAINNECNRNNIDYYFLESILKDIYEETLKSKEKELEEMKKQLEKEAGNELR